MKKITAIFVAGLGILCIAGCASKDRRAETPQSQSQRIMRENEHRLEELENSVNALNTQVAQLNNRVYEVRNSKGQKTAMRVVPVNAAPAQAAEAAPESVVVPPPPAPLLPLSNQPPAQAKAPAPAQKAAPKGRVINPKSKPAPLQAAAQPPAQPKKQPVSAAPAGASGHIGQPEIKAGPSGRMEAGAGEIGLPPADLPTGPQAGDQGLSVTGPASNAIAVPQGNVQTPVPTGNATAVPVPLMPSTDLSLPPEQPIAPQASAPAAPRAEAPARQAQAPAVQAPKPSARGEEAAYQAALRAARSGNTTEGIKLFRNFLRDYPNGRYAANADYWIGECLYSQGKYRDALSQFQNVNSSYPRHHKNADALLKAALTMNRLGDKAGADEKFRTLLSTFPNSDAARRARAMGAGR